MIVQIRIDDRLIHGQVALVWSKELNTPGIIVANDNAATNETVKMTLKMACPPGIKLLVRKVEDAKTVINDPRGKNMRIFGLTRNVSDALELVKACGGNILEVNLANAGIHDNDDSEKVTLQGNRVRLTEKEFAAAEELAKILGDKFISQLIPTSLKHKVADMLKTAKK